jgi:hypothetical protein
MSDFDLDLRTVEEHIDEEFEGEIVLGILDGTTPAAEWLDTVSNGAVLVLCFDGEVNDLASGFARDVKESGGTLIHFRGFLVVAPPGIDVDTERL